MSFEKVSPQALDTAVNICKNSIDYRNSLLAMNAINSSSVWQCGAKSKLNSALNKLINTKYKELVDELDKVTSASSLISSYKYLEDENDSYNYQIYNLQDDLYYDEEYTVTTTDDEGNEYTTIETRSVRDYYVENQIEDLKQKIKDNKEEMQNIENKVAALVG